MEKSEWLLMAIGDRIEPIQIQKTMFKFAKEADASSDTIYEFEPYNWGPCSFEIYDDLAILRERGLVETVPTHRGWSTYRLSGKGQREATELRSKANKKLLQKLDEVRQWVVSRTFEQLLRDVYAGYPMYAVQSMFTR